MGLLEGFPIFIGFRGGEKQIYDDAARQAKRAEN
jgi:hypothetical protein